MNEQKLREIEGALACKCAEHGEPHGYGGRQWYNACPQHGEGGLRRLAIDPEWLTESITEIRRCWKVMGEVAEEINRFDCLAYEARTNSRCYAIADKLKVPS